MVENPSVGEDKKKEPDWSNPNCSNPEEHDEADLCAQRQSVALSQSQVLLGVLGFAALMFTLGATVVTTKASVRSAKASEESARAATEQAIHAKASIELPLRAFLTVPEITFYNGDFVSVVIRNDGKTPANNVCCRARLTFVAGKDTSYEDEPTGSPTGFQILPDAKQEVVFDCSGGGTWPDTAVFNGSIDYNDWFEAPRETRFFSKLGLMSIMSLRVHVK